MSPIKIIFKLLALIFLSGSSFAHDIPSDKQETRNPHLTNKEPVKDQPLNVAIDGSFAGDKTLYNTNYHIPDALLALIPTGNTPILHQDFSLINGSKDEEQIRATINDLKTQGFYLKMKEIFQRENTEQLKRTIQSNKNLLSFTNWRKDTLLHFSVIFENIEMADFLMATDARLINAKNVLGITPFLLSVMRGQTRFAERFLQHPKTDFTVGDFQGDHVLHLVSLIIGKRNRREMIDLLLSDQYFERISHLIHTSNHSGEKPIQLAFRDFDLYVSQQFVNKVSDLKAENALGDNLIHTSVRLRDFKAIDFILQHKNIGINDQNHLGETPAHILLKDLDYFQTPDLIDILVRLLQYPTIELSVPDKNGDTVVDRIQQHHKIKKIIDQILLVEREERVLIKDFTKRNQGIDDNLIWEKRVKLRKKLIKKRFSSSCFKAFN